MIRNIGIDTTWRKTTTSCFFVSRCLNCNLRICIFLYLKQDIILQLKLKYWEKKLKGKASYSLSWFLRLVLLLGFFLFTSFAPLLDAVLKLLSHQICRDAVESLCPVLRAAPGIIRCCPLGETAAAEARHKQASVGIGLCSASQLLVFGRNCMLERAVCLLHLPKWCAQCLASEMTLWEDTSLHQCLRPYLHVCVSILAPLAACRWDVLVST